jgi:hypothetical protein
MQIEFVRRMTERMVLHIFLTTTIVDSFLNVIGDSPHHFSVLKGFTFVWRRPIAIGLTLKIAPMIIVGKTSSKYAY